MHTLFQKRPVHGRQQLLHTVLRIRRRLVHAVFCMPHWIQGVERVHGDLQHHVHPVPERAAQCAMGFGWVRLLDMQ